MTRIEADWKIIRARDGAMLVDEGDNLRGATPVERELAEQIERLKEGLFLCAKQAGADVSDGPPTWPAIVEWAVHAVIEMREVDEEGYEEVKKIAKKLARVATQDLHHRNAGRCPDSTQPNARDPLCAACKPIIAAEKLL